MRKKEEFMLDPRIDKAFRERCKKLNLTPCHVLETIIKQFLKENSVVMD